MRKAITSITLLGLVSACSSTSVTNNNVEPDAGTHSAGGNTSVGGAKGGIGGHSSTLAVGGVGVVGGNSAVGGATAKGGTNGVAGTSTNGAGASTGGASGTGTSTGGSISNGGNSASGGASAATGGLGQVGGTSPGTGGKSTGTSLTGGAPGNGGTPSTGGTSTAAGGSQTGGKTGAGGAATGGAATGGRPATGGAATGGAPPNPCASLACVHGTCVASGSTATCQCSTGYNGPLCDNNPNDCAGVTCSGHGNCVDGLGTYTCNCNSGYNGPTCATALPPTITQQPQDVTVCQGGGATFTVAATGAGALSYQWKQLVSGVSYDLGSGTSLAISTAPGMGSTTPPYTNSYYVVVTDSAGQTAQSRTAILSVPNPPAYVIWNWGIDYQSTTVPHLWVQFDAPASGCIYYTYSNNGSGFYTQQTAVCAGGGQVWPNVGMPPDYNVYSNNIVQVFNVEGNSGLACETQSTWVWDGSNQ